MPSMKIFALVTVLSTAIGLLLPISVAAVEEPVTKTLVWPDGTRYVGGVLDGKRSGKGTIFWQDGTRFVGQFENDMRNGPGTMILPDGNEIICKRAKEVSWRLNYHSGRSRSVVCPSWSCQLIALEHSIQHILQTL